jgi:CheY-like chemotaxis protein
VKALLRSAAVLIAADRATDAAQVRRALADTFDNIEVSTDGDLATADFDRVCPDVVVLAFETIEKSQAYCLGLLRFSKLAQSHPHRYVILCANADVGAVFALCKKDHFDDYVPYWPQPYDGHRVVMAVWNAMRRLLSARAQTPTQSEVAAHVESARALGAAVDRRVVQGLDHVAAVEASLAGVEREAGAARAPENVKRALAASRSKLAPMAEWADGFRSDVAPYLAGANALAGKLQPRRPIVLVVEDDAFAAKLIGKALEQQSFDLEFATAAPAVIEFLRRVHPMAILMDVNLPGMDGLSLTEWLKASPTLAHIPVLILTGEATREIIERSKTVGATGFIVKPFTREALLAKLLRVIG